MYIIINLNTFISSKNFKVNRIKPMITYNLF